MRDYGQAKRKAALRYGVGDGGLLPSNAQIEASLAQRQRIFEPDSHLRRVGLLRQLAAELMHLLAPFEPRLVGPVLAGTATSASVIELHLFADAPEFVAEFLVARGIRLRDYQKRFRFDQKSSTLVPGFDFHAGGETVYVLVFPEQGLRQAPLSPIDQRPMKRAARADVLALLQSRSGD